MKTSLLESKLWKFFCSLKLAIVLASASTLVVMGGSLVMPGNPQVFSAMDGHPFGAWLAVEAVKSPALTWWLPVAALLLFLLWLNTLCCFIDWLATLRRRWRKCGEYLIHLGFVLVLIAYAWGSVAGFRSEGNRVLVGQTVPLSLPGMYLRLESFEPVYNRTGRPVDMLNSLVLLEGDRVVARALARTNHPLTWKGLAVLPASFGQTPVAGWRGSGWRRDYRTYSVLTINYDPGANLALAGAVAMGSGVCLALFSFYRKRARGDRPDIA